MTVVKILWGVENVFKKNMLILIILIFCSIGYASADTGLHEPEYAVDESIDPETANIAEYTEWMVNIRRTDPQMFDEAKREKSTVAVYGTVPSLEGGDAYRWDRSLDRIFSAIQDDDALAKYHMSNGGFVHHYGYNIFGFGTVYLIVSREERANPQDIEDIKRIFDTYAEKEGITDFPVLFRTWDAVPVPVPGEPETITEDKLSDFFSSVIRIIKIFSDCEKRFCTINNKVHTLYFLDFI